MGLSLTSAPASEPVTLTEAKAHLRETGTGQDTLITSLITAARRWCEQYQQRAYITQTYTLKLDGFPCEPEGITGPVILLPKPPLVSVTSITYVDGDGASQTVSASDYVVQTDTTPGQIALAYDDTWPVTRAQENAVTVVYVAGYGAAAAVPETVKAAIKLVLADLYRVRETSIIGTIETPNPAAVRLLDMDRYLETV